MNDIDQLVSAVAHLVGPVAYEDMSTEDYVVAASCLYGPVSAETLAKEIQKARIDLLLETL